MRVIRKRPGNRKLHPSALEANAGAQPLVQLHFRLMGEFYYNRKALLSFEGACPAAVAPYDEIIVVTIGLCAARECYARRLQSAPFAFTRTWR
jgi:hypothetical protein